jgi:hypothetical protein
MQTTQQELNQLLVAVCALSIYILEEGALDSDSGRSQVREIFRQALEAIPEVKRKREWQIAAAHIEAANALEAAEPRSTSEGV